MAGIKLFRTAIERHRENKDITVRFKTPARILSGAVPLILTVHQLTVRNVNTFVDEQAIDDACNPIRFGRHVRVSEWIRGIQRVR